jgi:PhzF family phenazine biosynthesis protein
MKKASGSKHTILLKVNKSTEMISPLHYFVVDAFTSQPFAGNPAAVMLLDNWRDDAWLQHVAMEMNLSETAFLVARSHGFDLRWFTPKVEVDLCGHATLASAMVLSHLGKMADGSSVPFSTRSGDLNATRSGEQFQLDFPLKPAEPATPPVGLVEALNVRPIYIGRNQYDFLVELESEPALRGVAPDFKLLAKVDCRGIIVTAASEDPRFHFVSRFFAPAAGIDEDPVTGSAHCCLADFWGRRLGKAKMTGFQASRRGGIVHVEVRDDRVILGGNAVIVAKGELIVG